MLLGLVSGFIYTTLSGNNRKLRRCTCEERDRLLVVKLQVHEPDGLTSADRFTATHCFCIRPRVQTSAPLHVYPITANDLPQSRQRAIWTYEASGISLNSSARSLLLLMKQSRFFFFLYLLAASMCCVLLLDCRAPRTGEQPHRDPWRRFPPLGARRLHPCRTVTKAAVPHRLRGAKSCRATPKYYDWVRKAFTHLDRLNKEALSTREQGATPPSTPHEGTRSDQRADKWYELCSLRLRVSLQRTQLLSPLRLEFQREKGKVKRWHSNNQSFLSLTFYYLQSDVIRWDR